MFCNFFNLFYGFIAGYWILLYNVLNEANILNIKPTFWFVTYFFFQSHDRNDPVKREKNTQISCNLGSFCEITLPKENNPSWSFF